MGGALPFLTGVSTGVLFGALSGVLSGPDFSPFFRNDLPRKFSALILLLLRRRTIGFSFPDFLFFFPNENALFMVDVDQSSTRTELLPLCGTKVGIQLLLKLRLVGNRSDVSVDG
mmetsp:Transcript_2485/g.6627  ORF Transcript_2485/g.6627 Transcript_2485/m.6627 type:complete len:115 (+) Transcript_2485:2098-2442(+)